MNQAIKLLQRAQNSHSWLVVRYVIELPYRCAAASRLLMLTDVPIHKSLANIYRHYQFRYWPHAVLEETTCLVKRHAVTVNI